MPDGNKDEFGGNGDLLKKLVAALSSQNAAPTPSMDSGGMVAPISPMQGLASVLNQGMSGYLKGIGLQNLKKPTDIMGPYAGIGEEF